MTEKSFIQIFIETLTKNYSNFEGRARRREYWGFGLVMLFVLVLSVTPLLFLDPEMQESISKGYLSILGLLLLSIIVPALALTVRRLHDINRSGLWYFVNFIPYIGGFVLLIFSLTEGTVGPNQYGPDPKQKDADEIQEIGKQDIA